METIRGLHEVVDAENNGEGCLEARTAALAYFEGLGPVDLCRLTKTIRPTSSASSKEPGEDLKFFHYVVGLDVADASHVSGHIATIIGGQEHSPWFSSLFETQKWHISGGVYCCYNAFERVDVRVEVRIPGIPGVVEYAVDASGNEVELGDQIWEGARLSAMLRSTDVWPDLPALVVLPLLTQHGNADAFLQLATRYFDRSGELGLSPQIGRGTHLFCELVCDYIIRSRRLQLAVDVLWRIQSIYPPVAVHIARAYVKHQQFDSALEVLCQALHANPEDAPLLHYQAKVLLKHGVDLELAVQSAELAVKYAPKLWVFWVTLAKAYAAASRFEEALATLNSKMLSSKVSEADPELGLPDLSEAEQTTPKDPALIGIPLWKPDDYEMIETGGAQFRGFGRSFGLVPELDERVTSTDSTATSAGDAVDDLGDFATCQGASLSPQEQGAYEVLVMMHNTLGWEGLLARRSNIFLMADDNDADDAASTAAEDEETDDQSSSTKLPKRLSTRFMDRLFHTLYSDLCLLDEWHEEEQESASHTDDALELETRGSCELWMHRGALAERLQQPRDMEIALRYCQARGTCLRASMRLLKLYLSRNRRVEAVAQLALLAGAMSDAALDAQGVSGTCCPDWLFDAAAQLICACGMRGVCAGMARLPEACREHRNSLMEVLKLAQEAEVDGFDR